MKNALTFVVCLLCSGTRGVAARTDTERRYHMHTFEFRPAFSYITYKEPHRKSTG